MTRPHLDNPRERIPSVTRSEARRRTSRGRALGLAASAVLLCHCGHGGGPVPQASQSSAHGDGATTAEVAPSAEAPPAATRSEVVPKPASRPQEARERPVLLLAEHRARGELRRGATLLVDFGVPGGRKYDFGGWLSGTAEDRLLDGNTALLAKGKQMRLSLPIEHTGSTILALRMRSFARTKATVYIDGERIGGLSLAGDGFETHRLRVDAARLPMGEHELLVRVARSGAVPGGGRSGLAIDWLVAGPGTPATEAAIAAQASEPPQANEETDSLVIPAEHAIQYGLEVPEGARLRATVSPPDALVTVRADLDGAPSQVLLQGAAADGLDVDLASVRGHVARLSIEAGPRPLKLMKPRVVTLEPASDSADSATGTRQTAPQDQGRIDNVLVILIDTLRADRLSPYNAASRVKTPGLASFVQHAAVLTNARTQENWTKPSVATLLSSLMPWEHNASSDASRVPRSVNLLPEVLKERGFHTGCFIANGYVSDKFGFKQGWHTYRNYIREGRRAKAQYVAADVLDWLDQRPKDKPFFLYMHTIDPHVPYKPPASFLRMYDEDDYRGPVNFRKSATLLERIKVGSLKLNRRDKRRLEALYDAEISYHDVHFAAVLRGLEQRGLADNTMVVVTADHGEEFWDHGSVGHGHSVYDELLHIPLIVRVPGVTHGALKLSEAAGLVDVMPTILDALNQEPPEGMSGRSFLPWLRGQAPTAPPVTVSGFMRGWRTLAVGRLKLVQRTLGKRWLYDTAADPAETEDLASDRPLALRYTRGLLGLALASSENGVPGRSARPRPKRRHRRQDVHIDDETKAQLEALGYVGSSKPD